MKNKRNLFLNSDGVLRIPLQILIAGMTLLFFMFVGQLYAGTAIYTLVQKGILPSAVMDSYFLSGLLPEAILNFAAAGVILFWYRLLNKKKLETMGVPAITRNIKTIFLGIGTIALMQACIAGVLLVVGDVKFTGLQFHSSIWQYFLLMSSVSFAEEVLNRGFIQHLVKRKTSVFWSCMIPSIIFTMYHLRNPGIKPLGLFNIFLVGMCFSLATQRTGNIWFAFGAHLMWNAGSACVFGLMSVSATTGSVLNFEYQKATLFNGFAESPLYGLIGTMMWGLLTLLLVFQIKKQNK